MLWDITYRNTEIIRDKINCSDCLECTGMFWSVPCTRLRLTRSASAAVCAGLAEAVPNVRAAVVWSVAGCGYLGFIKKKEAQIST
mgnify:CR=1 FL=1